MSSFLYPGLSIAYVHVLTVIPLSSLQYTLLPTVAYNPYLFLSTYVYLAYCLTCIFYCTPALPQSIHTALLSYPYTLLHTHTIYTYVQSFTYFYLLSMLAILLTYMPFFFAPRPIPCPVYRTYCHATTPVSYLPLLAILYFSSLRVLVIFAYLAFLRTCLSYGTPALTLSLHTALLSYTYAVFHYPYLLAI
jgi:hypothetical protein